MILIRAIQFCQGSKQGIRPQEECYHRNRESARSPLRLGASGRGEVSDKLGHALAESDYEQSKSGNGDCEEETVGNEFITHWCTYKSAHQLASCDIPIGGQRLRTSYASSPMSSLNRGEQM